MCQLASGPSAMPPPADTIERVGHDASSDVAVRLLGGQPNSRFDRMWGHRRGTRLMFLDQQTKVIVTFDKEIRFSSRMHPAATFMYAQNVG